MKLPFHLDYLKSSFFNLLLFARDFFESLFTIERHTFLILRLYLKAESLRFRESGRTRLQQFAADALTLVAGQYIQASNVYDVVAWPARRQKPDYRAVLVFCDVEKDPLVLYLSGQRFRAVPERCHFLDHLYWQKWAISVDPGFAEDLFNCLNLIKFGWLNCYHPTSSSR